MKAFRILKNSIRDSFKSIFRNISLSFASILCTTITLILVTIAIVISSNVSYITKKMERELTILVYANRDTTEEALNNIKTSIEEIPKVESVTFKSKSEQKLEMQQYSETLEVTLENLENNPLLDSYVVKVLDVSDLAPVTKEIRKIEGISSADYGEGMVEEIISAFNIIKTSTVVMVIALIVVTAFLISNTIKLTIFSRRSEIDIMRLVGASNTSIKLPFVFEGFLLGSIGSLIPIIITIYGYYILYDKISLSKTFGILELIKPFPFVFYVIIILLLIGAIVGMLGSGRAVRKYLKI